MNEYENKKGFKVKEFDDTLNLVDCLSKRGYYRFLVYDTTRGMNIGHSDVSEIESLFVALKYYQGRLMQVEADFQNLQNKVDEFLNKFNNEEKGDWND